MTLEQTPKGATYWSSRMLAARTGLSQSSINRIWRAFGLKPHRSEGFQLSTLSAHLPKTYVRNQ